MPQLLGSILEGVSLTTIVDIGITALLIYWLFSLIRGTRAVRLVIGVSVLFVVYALAVAFDLRLLTQILQAGAVVGLFALVVVFQPELRRALERIGRVGSFGWLLSPAESRAAELVATEVARAAAELSAEGHGALIVLERETGLEEVAETGVMIHGDVSADLLNTIFMPRSPLHDGAVIIRDDRIVAAGAPAATGRDLDPYGAVRDPPSGRPGDHRADRRGRDRGLRGERPDQPRRTRPDRAQPHRGGPQPRDPRIARPGRWPAGRPGLAGSQRGSGRRRHRNPADGRGQPVRPSIAGRGPHAAQTGSAGGPGLPTTATFPGSPGPAGPPGTTADDDETTRSSAARVAP